MLLVADSLQTDEFLNAIGFPCLGIFAIAKLAFKPKRSRAVRDVLLPNPKVPFQNPIGSDRRNLRIIAARPIHSRRRRKTLMNLECRIPSSCPAFRTDKSACARHCDVWWLRILVLLCLCCHWHVRAEQQ